ncbi:hypothetical protein KAU11_08880 [Candidatus Babeliales bacterium]|nr:hypothetical protein [Candidatus Babeliales bacterium]
MNYSKIYNIDFRVLANLLTPPFLRKERLIDWLVVLLKPLEEVNFSFNQFRRDSIYKVTHNGQVVFLQKVLNDRFDNEFRRVKIADSFEYNPVWVRPEEDELPVYVYEEDKPVFIHSESDVFGDVDVDFIVSMPLDLKPVAPIDLTNLELQIKSLTNYYKLASKRYLIEWI